MKKVELLLITLLVTGMSSAVSAEGVYFGSGLGVGDLEIQAGFLTELPTFLEDNDGAIVADFFGGYEFTNGTLIELGFGGYGNFNFFNIGDNISFFSNKIGVGYVFPSESKFKFFGKVGMSFWELELSEGVPFTSGFGEILGTRTGQDPYFQIGSDYRFNNKLRLGLNYSYSDTEFGEASGVTVNLKWFPWGDNIN